MSTFRFEIPSGMKAEEVAKTFNAYLRGSQSFQNKLLAEGTYQHGPYRKRAGSDDDWQLDDTNDFWLRIREDGSVIECRYDGYDAIVVAMIALFTLRYPKRARKAA